MFTCPLLCNFCKSIKIAKFKGANIKFQILENRVMDMVRYAFLSMNPL